MGAEAKQGLNTWVSSAWLGGQLVWFAHCTSCATFSRPYPTRVGATNSARGHDCKQVCAHCSWARPHHNSWNRKLCIRCFNDPDIRLDYPRATRRYEDTLEDYDELRREGYTVRLAAARMGMTYANLDKALERARQKGDPRAVRNPYR